MKSLANEYDEIINVTTELLYTLAQNDAERYNRYIVTEEQLSQAKQQVAESGEIIDKYLFNYYINERRIAENDFLIELFALFECIDRALKLI